MYLKYICNTTDSIFSCVQPKGLNQVSLRKPDYLYIHVVKYTEFDTKPVSYTHLDVYKRQEVK